MKFGQPLMASSNKNKRCVHGLVSKCKGSNSRKGFLLFCRAVVLSPDNHDSLFSKLFRGPVIRAGDHPTCLLL